MRYRLIFSTVMAFGLGGVSLAQEFRSLPSNKRLDRKSVAALGLSQESLAEISEIQNVAKRHAVTGLEPGTAQVFSLDPSGAIIRSQIPAASPNQMFLSPSLVGRLQRRTPLDIDGLLRIGSFIRPILKSRDAVQSVPPDGIPQTDSLPPKAMQQARENGLQSIPRHGACSMSQDTFNSKVETSFNGLAIYRSRVGKDRSDFISAANDYDHDCLVPVVIAQPPVSGPPLARLAVLLDVAGNPVCMALHLGDDRFITARHCFFSDRGPWPEMAEGKLQMIDGSDPRPIVMTPEPPNRQPYMPTNGPITSGRDVLLFRASGLAAAVRARSEFIDFAPNTTVAQEAYIAGVYLLATPDKSVPIGIGMRGIPPNWTQALRATKVDATNTCRVWDRSKAADGSDCIEHSCQTLPGFSGSPVFVRSKDSSKWLVAGINVAGADGRSSCGAFEYTNGRGLMKGIGAIAAAIPASVVNRTVASVAIAKREMMP